MRIYLETTIPSYLAARPAKALLQAASQEATHLWWNCRSAADELVSSGITLDEVRQGDPDMAKARLGYLAGLPMLPVDDAVLSLFSRIATSGLLPAAAKADATHIALATAHRCDILLTWNCRHIANAAIQRRLRALAEVAGYVLPTICTPYELLQRNDE